MSVDTKRIPIVNCSKYSATPDNTPIPKKTPIIGKVQQSPHNPSVIHPIFLSLGKLFMLLPHFG